MANQDYRKGYVSGYNKAASEYKAKEIKNNIIVHCKYCKWWSKNKLKCYRPFAHRQANANSFCDKGVINEKHL